MKRFRFSNPLEALTQIDFDRLQELVECAELDFLKAVDILGLDPISDFRNSNLLGVRFSGVNLDEFDFSGALLTKGATFWDPEILEARRILEAFGSTIPSSVGKDHSWSEWDANTSGIFLWGSVGRGKSTLLREFFDDVESKKKGVFDFRKFMRDIHKRIERARREGNSDPVSCVALSLSDEFQLLCLDGFSVHDILDAMTVGRLFSKLLDTGMKLVLVSSYHPENLYKNGLNYEEFWRYFDTALSRLLVHEICGEIDYRERLLSRHARWYLSSNPKSKDSLEQIWFELSGGVEHQIDLSDHRVALTVQRFSRGNAWMGFQELCAKPNGAKEYLKLADSVQVLMIDGVTKLGSTSTNIAERFSLLIDCMYEQERSLIVSAEVVPELIFENCLEEQKRLTAISRLKSLISEKSDLR